ncbi:MAG: phosphate ABC transporter substrate-binding protein [Clostridia bacterium]|nr:phosphate ABC transporter substrate-binding protein [Clostridia bacterium]
MKMKKLVAMVMALTAMGSVATFSACGDTQTIEIAGSTSVQPLMGVLADAYMAKHDDVQIKVEGGGSSIGVSNAKEGKGDFGMASKAVSETGVTAVKVCDDGIIVIVNKQSALTDVTGVQLFDLYVSGTALGAVTMPVTRESGSGTRDAFEGLVKGADGTKLETVSNRAPTQEFSSTGTAMTYVEQNANALGYISLGSYDQKKVKKLTFEGVEATAENVKNGSYKLARPFNILYNTEKSLSDAAQGFLDFILSKEGQAIVAEEGYITL